MMRGMYAAISGLEAHQTMFDVTANNLANVDTVGFKAQRTTFVDELSQLVRASGLAAVVATHNMELAGRMDRRVSLVDGQVVELD